MKISTFNHFNCKNGNWLKMKIFLYILISFANMQALAAYANLCCKIETSETDSSSKKTYDEYVQELGYGMCACYKMKKTYLETNELKKCIFT